ncbi:MAG: hypothetical protein K0S01_1445 [Herbinix sp.]|jgi:hypothetical protein|nr:hypothetical protein [Herbinix sp.]
MNTFVNSFIQGEVNMDEPIDTKKLRLDLMNFYGTALFAGFDGALEDLLELDKESEEELIKRAIKKGIDLQKYKEIDH